MTGKLSGKQYRVVGRVVLGEEEEGGTYYWNEFNLETDAGEVATLVYEETERGVEWRLFQMFEPGCPMAAADAATKREGDPLDLDGTHMFVRLVSKSRVYHIEGKAPEGVDLGDMAHYFNAVAGNTMMVVSWTGEEVEFYKGLDLSPTTVSAAFNVRLVNFSRLFRAPGGSRQLSGLVVVLVVALVLVIVMVFGYHAFMPSRRPPARARTRPPGLAFGGGKDRQVGGNPFPGSEPSAGRDGDGGPEI